MNCIYCGTPLSDIDYCTGCGADITILKRVARISNLLYNEGLDKARVRDLSGAIKSLKRSLEFNKENKDARNLLGLVYFESGEVVSALTEWVISKNMNPDDNLAEYYIDKLQSNKNKLDTINQTIRKYNQALVYCREDHDDMAMIQLKKVLSQNPKLIKAYHLLALLYLKHQDYEKARKLLKKAAFIDTNNTTTLRYLQEVELATGISTSLDVKRKKKYAKEKVDRLSGTVTYMNGNEMIIQPTTFRDSSAVATFINIFLGIVLGAAVVWFLVVPSTRQSIYEKANAQVTDANSQMAAQVSRVQGLQEEIDGYQSKVDAANKAKEEADKKADSYDEILQAANYYLANDMTKAADAFNQIEESSMTGKGQELYATLKTALADYVFTEAYNAGATAFASGDYKTAITQLKRRPKPRQMISMPGIIWPFLTVTTTIRKRRTRSSGRSYSSSRHRRQLIIFPATSQAILHRAAVRQMPHRVRRPEERTPQIQPEQPIPQMQPGQRITPPGRMTRPEMIRPEMIPQAITVLRISTTCLALNKKI